MSFIRGMEDKTEGTDGRNVFHKVHENKINPKTHEK